MKKVMLFANTDWYLYNFRRSFALALKEAGYDPLLISPPGPYADRLIALGLRWEPISMQRRSLNPFRESLLFIQLIKLIKQEKPDFLHNFTLKSSIYGSIASNFSRTPAVVNSIDGLGYVFTSSHTRARLLRPIVRTLMRLSFSRKKSRLVLLNNDDLQTFKRESLAPFNNIRLIRGAGVDCNRFTPEGKSTSTGRLSVLLPSRILWDKGLAEYIEAARTLKEKRNIDFFIAGSPDVGNPASVPAQVVNSWVSEGLVTWLGHVEDMPALYRSMDVVALPSYREGLPTSLTEAAASGCALITTDAPGCREVVKDGVDGLLIPVRDGKALATAITKLDDDRSLLRRLGSAARAKALAEFDEKIVIARTLAVYDELQASA